MNISKSRLVRILSGVLACVVSVNMILPGISAEDNENSEATAVNETVEKPEVQDKINLPESMHGSVLNISELEGDDTDGSVTNAVSYLASLQMNGIFINPYGESAYFNTDMNDASDKLSSVLSAADKVGVNRFVYYDIGKALENCPEDNDSLNYLVSELHRFVLIYPCTGIILTGFCTDMNNNTYLDYMESGSGVGYTNWLYDSVYSRLKVLCETVKLTDNTVAVGLMVDVWANSDTEGGSETSSSYEEYVNGYADTKKIVVEGLCDFITVNAEGSLTDANAAFDKVCTWWDDVVTNAGINMYILHHNELLGTDAEGWGAEDQLLRQMVVTEELSSYNGSIMNSFTTLQDNPMGTTDTLIKYFNDQINPDSLFEDLEMTSPYYTNYSTTENSVAFMGTFDENFDVYFDGEKLSLNEAGNFYFEKNLEVGMNYFEIKHKDKTVTYSIERTINVLKSVGTNIFEGKVIRADGGFTVSLLAVAYKGSTVTATINGVTVPLYENSHSDDGDLNSSYASFTGKYVLPEGIVDQEQNLGYIQIDASYMGYYRSYTGASVIVNAKEPPAQTDVVIEDEITDQSSAGSGEVVGRLSPSVTEDTPVSFVRLNKNYVYIYDGKNDDSVNPPNVGQLPMGTLDYYYYGNDEYYITTSGKRFLIEDAEIIDGVGLGSNALVVEEIGNTGGDSYIKLALEDKTSFTVTPIGNDYYSGYDGDFYLDSFTAEYIYITFDNLTSVTSLPSFDNCTVFSAGEWQQVEVDGVMKFRLVLKLRYPGVYAGNCARYNDEGKLMLTFEILTNNIANMTIVIDPGHGLTEGGYHDPGAIGHIEEANANLAVAKLLEQKLTALGANVVRLHTEDTFYDTKQRPYVAREYGCDLYIAIHSNKAGVESARGTECYYYTSWSQPLAEALTNSVSSYFTNYVYSDYADRNRGDLYSYMWTTKQQDFPSVLIEMGFVSNYEDAMALADPVHQDGIAQAIADGILTYISRSSISNY